jgi:hypothetical protein
MASDENVILLLSFIGGALSPEQAAQLLRVCDPLACTHAI